MRRVILALLVATPVFAQLPSNTVSITATRSFVLQPDQVQFTLTVSSAPSTTLDQAAASLASLGITAGNLTGVQNSGSNLQWSFSYAAPLANLTTAIASLIQLQQTIGQNASGLALTFNVSGTQVSSQLQQSQQSQSCSDAELIADATGQGQKLAAAAGVALGPILRLTNAPISEAVSQIVPAGARSGFLTVGDFLELLLAPAPSPSTCSLTVAFQLLP